MTRHRVVAVSNSVSLLLASAAVLLLARPVSAGPCQVLTPSTFPGNFGTDLSLDGNSMAVSAPNAGGGGNVLTYEFDGVGWVKTQILAASDALFGDNFGASLMISGDAMIVGAPFEDDGGADAGAAYMFRNVSGTWIQEQKLLPADIASNDRFGRATAIDGNVAVIGSWFDDDAGSTSGSAYVFRFNGSVWIEEQKLTASDAASTDRFGDAVAIDGDTIVVGAYQEDEAGPDAGAAYVFRYNGATWVEHQKLLASDAQPSDAFSRSIDIEGDNMLIGALTGDAPGEIDAGAAYVFSWHGVLWVEQQKLTASDAETGDQFFVAALSGTRAIVGALTADAAYLFEWNGMAWVESTILTPPGGQTGINYGNAVAVHIDLAFVGANVAAYYVKDQGAVFVIDPDHIPVVINVLPGESIQAAINSACFGDEVIVHPGEYFESIVIRIDGLSIRSVNPMDSGVVAATSVFGQPAILVENCYGSMVMGVSMFGVQHAGFIAINSNATLSQCDLIGGSKGGVFNEFSTATVTDCRFISNSGTDGGGGLVCYDNAVISDCSFVNNRCTVYSLEDGGGGMRCGTNAVITNCLFYGNRVIADDGFEGSGGGLACGAGSHVINCTFIDNECEFRGGGLSSYGVDSPVTVSYCTFEGNIVASTIGGFQAGGGLFCHSAVVSNCIVTNNFGSIKGGGIAVGTGSIINCKLSGNQSVGNGGGAYIESGVVANCIFTANSCTELFASRGGGLWCSFDHLDVTVANCTFYGNSSAEGGAIYTPSLAVVTNCVLRSNVTTNGIDLRTPPSSPVTYCNIQGGFPGIGNIDEDPLFVDPDGPDNIAGTEDDDLRLSAGSPCIDAGDNAAVPSDAADLDEDENVVEPIPFDVAGEARFVDDPSTADTGNGTVPIVDIGAHEFDPATCASDIAPPGGDGNIGVPDLLAIINAWGPCPVPCSADIAPPGRDGNVGVPDLLAVINAWGPCE